MTSRPKIPRDLAQRIEADGEVLEFLSMARVSVQQVVGLVRHHFRVPPEPDQAVRFPSGGRRSKPRALGIASKRNHVLVPMLNRIQLLPLGGGGAVVERINIDACEVRKPGEFYPSTDAIMNLANSLASFTRLLAKSRKATSKQTEKIISRLQKWKEACLDYLDSLPAWRRRRRQNMVMRLLDHFRKARPDLGRDECLHIAGRICKIAGVERGSGDPVERISRRLRRQRVRSRTKPSKT